MIERPFDLNIEEVLESWETRHGIRELVANAFDEQVLSNTQAVEIGPIGPKKWRIRDFGRGLAPEHLTQKENPEKLNNPDKVIGKFGVGLKDALGVLHRRGVKVEIVSRHACFRVEMRPKIGFQGTRTLHAVVSPPRDTRFVGTEVTLTGATQADVEGAKACFLQFSDEVELEATRYGQVLARRPGQKARIYIIGVLMAEDEGFLFSYNVAAPTKAMRDALNRERNNVGRTAFQQRVRDILLKCQSDHVGEALASALARSGPGRDELGWIDVAQHASKFLNRSKVVMVTAEQLRESPSLVDDAVRDGYRLVTIDTALAAKIEGLTDVDGNQIRSLAAFAEDRARSFEFDWVGDDKLSAQEKAVFDARHAIARLVGGFPRDVKEVRISRTMRPGFHGDDACGLWAPDRRAIIVRLDQLRSRARFAATLLHELAHARSGAPDVDREFEEQLTTFLGWIADRALVQ